MSREVPDLIISARGNLLREPQDLQIQSQSSQGCEACDLKLTASNQSLTRRHIRGTGDNQGCHPVFERPGRLVCTHSFHVALNLTPQVFYLSSSWFSLLGKVSIKLISTERLKIKKNGPPKDSY